MCTIKFSPPHQTRINMHLGIVRSAIRYIFISAKYVKVTTKNRNNTVIVLYQIRYYSMTI